MKVRPLVLARRISQAVFLGFFVYVLWSTAYPLTGSIPPALIFKIDPLIMITTSISERVFLPGLALSAGLLILTAIFGRFFCGWICPLGSVIDAVGDINAGRNSISDQKNAVLRKVKYAVVGSLFFLAIFGCQAAWIFDPIVIMGRFVSLNLIPSVTHLIKALFVILIKHMHLGGAVKDFYHVLKPAFLGVSTAYFSHAAVIFLSFAVICAASLLVERFWCRAVCPLGAILSLAGRFSPLKRTIDECRSCGICKSRCRMGAVRNDMSYIQSDCVLCMDCVYDCPTHITRFRFISPVVSGKGSSGKAPESRPGISRKTFILLALGGLTAFATKFKAEAAGVRSSGVIRPPAALQEEAFVNRCVRCGNCMKVCPTNALHPVMFRAGLEGIWTPELLADTGYCEYQCVQCGLTCPTGAIPVLTKELKAVCKLGTAEIDKTICLPWAEGKECLVCQEHCPVPEKAIKTDTYAGGPARPYVDEYLCVGCGICQNKCPVRPKRAINVTPRGAERSHKLF